MKKDPAKDENLAEIDEAFGLLHQKRSMETVCNEAKDRDKEWKQRDPEGYKKDMENMCRQMFGEKWQVEYETMLRGEFPEEFS
ncbi:MAG: hypothetical protein HY913_21755 [Desulfomonile tiedjei]|nr:hypothetical protein [Desulfomonile tiedjei]